MPEEDTVSGPNASPVSLRLVGQNPLFHLLCCCCCCATVACNDRSQKQHAEQYQKLAAMGIVEYMQHFDRHPFSRTTRKSTCGLALFIAPYQSGCMGFGVKD